MIICLDYTYIYSNIVYSSDIAYYTGYSTSNTTPSIPVPLLPSITAIDN